MAEAKQTYRSWHCWRFQDYSKFPPVSAPLLHNIGGEKVAMRFSRYPITGYSGRERNAALPAPTQRQIEAIDAVHFMAAENAIPLPMGKGDIVFINDMAILHAREPFSEGGVRLQRHLLKFYLRDPEQNWSVPPTAADALRKIYGPNCGDGTRKEMWCPSYGPSAENDWTANGWGVHPHDDIGHSTWRIWQIKDLNMHTANDVN